MPLYRLLLFICLPSIAWGHLDPSTWRIIDVSSENVLTGETATLAIDGNPETQWHTQWHTTREIEPARPPHTITIDLQKEHPITAIRYRARAHGEGGLPRQYQVELGTSPEHWAIVAEGESTFRSQMSPHAVVTLDQSTNARFLRLTINSVHPSARAMEPGLVVSEIDVATAESPLIPTTLLPVPASREWSYGGYVWQHRHHALLRYAAEHHPRLVFIGDSITHRWGAPPQDNTTPMGESVWKHYYAHRNAISLGFGWDRLENMLWRLQHGELEETDPCLVVVMAGTNNFEVNTPQEIAAGIAGLCDEIHRQKPQAHILLLAIFPRREIGDTLVLADTNQQISELGQRDYITFKDIGSAFLNDQGDLTRDIMPDLLHPNTEGYARWAQAIEPEVSRFMADKPIEPLKTTDEN